MFESVVSNFFKKNNIYIWNVYSSEWCRCKGTALIAFNEFEPKGNYNIGITAGVETTVVPREFLEGGNKMDLIIVPSQFTKSLFDKLVKNNKFKNKLLKEIKFENKKKDEDNVSKVNTENNSEIFNYIISKASQL